MPITSALLAPGVRRRVVGVLLLALMSMSAGAASRDRSVTVFAAASLTDALRRAGDEFTKSTGISINFSFAASSTLARQIEAGAAADLFVSADVDWMDYLEQRGLIQRVTRRNLLGNRLALVAPTDSKLVLTIVPHFSLRSALGDERLATGDPESVPVGRYAREALTSLGVWDSVADRLVRADNVRSALMFVERGEVPIGIVYATDAAIDPKVRIVDLFPEGSHSPIVYPVALLPGAPSGAARFYDYLRSTAAMVLFARYGFEPLP